MLLKKYNIVVVVNLVKLSSDMIKEDFKVFLNRSDFALTPLRLVLADIGFQMFPRKIQRPSYHDQPHGELE